MNIETLYMVFGVAVPAFAWGALIGFWLGERYMAHAIARLIDEHSPQQAGVRQPLPPAWIDKGPPAHG